MRKRISAVGWAHIVAFCAAVVITFVSIGSPTKQTPSVAPARENVSSNPASSKMELVSRHLYPYSVIPGGVESGAELRTALAHDPVAALHYEDFNVQRAHVVRLQEDQLAYVSYRLGNRIFWTNKKLKLAKGETVITDDVHVARTRCGNRVSLLPVLPVSPEQPAPRDLETPPAPEVAILLPPPVPFPPTTPPPAPVTPPSPPVGPPGGGIIPPPILPPTGGGGHPPVVPPIPIPEPGLPEMLVAGIAAVGLFRWAKHSWRKGKR